MSPREAHLLSKEIEAQGELLSQERLERIADIDRLEMELTATRTALEKMLPGFAEAYAAALAQHMSGGASPTSTKEGEVRKTG